MPEIGSHHDAATDGSRDGSRTAGDTGDAERQPAEQQSDSPGVGQIAPHHVDHTRGDLDRLAHAFESLGRDYQASTERASGPR